MIERIQGTPVARIWTEDAQTKILQTVEYTRKTGDVLTVAAARNEYRGAQIQAFATEDVSTYDLEVSDLQGKGIDGKIARSNVAVYVEKYTKIAHKSNAIAEFLPGSRIPDALVPLAAVREKGEDKIRKGENQGFYVDVKVDTHTPPGLYTGSATLRLNDSVYRVPIALTVYDFILPDATPTKNYWGMFDRSESLRNELDAGDEMAEAYYEFMLEHRINCELLPFSGIGGSKRYVQLLRKYYHRYGFSTYRLPVEHKACVYGGEPIDFDADSLKSYIAAIVRASVDDQVNYLDKAFVYFVYSPGIDEPQSKESYEKVQRFSKVYGMLREQLDGELQAELSGRPEYAFYADTIRKTVLQLPTVLTLCHPNHFWDIQAYDIGNFTYCPVANVADSPRVRRTMFAQSPVNWWYTCTGPVYPYPSTHLDDYAVSMRLIGWMQKAYRLDGYLNWAAAIQHRLEYPYTNPDIGFSNGDGFILYAGRYYGIRGPVGSLRAIAFRDGMQDYCYLDAAEKQIGADALQRVYDELFNGMRVLVSDAGLLDTLRGELVRAITRTGEIRIDPAVTGERVPVDACDDAGHTVVCANSKHEPRIETSCDARYSAKGRSLKINLQGTTDIGTFYPRIFIESTNINNGNFAELKSITFKIYGTTDTPTHFIVYGLDEVFKTVLYETDIEKGLNVVTVPLLWQKANPMKFILFETDNFYDAAGPRLFYVDEVTVQRVRPAAGPSPEPSPEPTDGIRPGDLSIPWGCSCFGRLTMSDEHATNGQSVRIEVYGSGTMRTPEQEWPVFTVAAHGDYSAYTNMTFCMYNDMDRPSRVEFFANTTPDCIGVRGVTLELAPGPNSVTVPLTALNADATRIRIFGFRFPKYAEMQRIQVYYLDGLRPAME